MALVASVVEGIQLIAEFTLETLPVSTIQAPWEVILTLLTLT